MVSNLLFCVQISKKGVDGEEIQIAIPSGSEVSNLVLESENQYRVHMGIVLSFMIIALLTGTYS